MAEYVAVAKVSDLAAGSGKVVDVNGKAVALFNVNGTFYAIENTCRHQGGPLGEGALQGAIVTCPWHMWEYNVTTGEFTANPAIKVASYPVQVEGDEVKVAVWSAVSVALGESARAPVKPFTPNQFSSTELSFGVGIALFGRRDSKYSVALERATEDCQLTTVN